MGDKRRSSSRRRRRRALALKTGERAKVRAPDGVQLRRDACEICAQLPSASTTTAYLPKHKYPCLTMLN